MQNLFAYRTFPAVQTELRASGLFDNSVSFIVTGSVACVRISAAGRIPAYITASGGKVVFVLPLFPLGLSVYAAFAVIFRFVPTSFVIKIFFRHYFAAAVFEAVFFHIFYHFIVKTISFFQPVTVAVFAAVSILRNSITVFDAFGIIRLLDVMVLFRFAGDNYLALTAAAFPVVAQLYHVVYLRQTFARNLLPVASRKITASACRIGNAACISFAGIAEISFFDVVAAVWNRVFLPVVTVSVVQIAFRIRKGITVPLSAETAFYQKTSAADAAVIGKIDILRYKRIAIIFLIVVTVSAVFAGVSNDNSVFAGSSNRRIFIPHGNFVIVTGGNIGKILI